ARRAAFDDVRRVLTIRRAHAMAAVALDVVVHAEARGDAAVLRRGVAAAVDGIILVVARADVEGEVVVEIPLVVDEERIRTEVALVGADEDRRPADERATA